MSVNIKRNGTLQKIADQTLIFDANCAEVRTGTYSIECMSDSGANATITFSTPMPDNNYIVIFKQESPAAGEIGFRACTTTGFNLFVLGGRFGSAAEVMTFTGTYYAFKLIELENYTALQNKVNNSIDSSPTQNSTNFVTSGGVYDAIKNASSVFIGTSSEWESETSKTDYQIAILTDQPTVNAVDNTDGSTTVVGEPNKRWTGSQNEWNNLTAAEKAKYEIVCFNDDNGASGKDIYSTTETKTNKVWIDGKPIYRKVFTNIPFPEEADITQDNTSVASQTTNVFPGNYISDIVSASFVAIHRTYGKQYSLPRRWQSANPDTSEPVIIWIDAGIATEDSVALGYYIEVRSNRTSFNNEYYKLRAIIEYTKVGD